MAVYGKPSPKSKISFQLQKQLDTLTNQAVGEAAAIKNEDPPWWFIPAGFFSDLFSIEKMHDPFTRKDQEEEFREVVENADEPGTIGDLHMIQLQGDFLAAMERAFRARHHTACRTRIQPAGRRYGHGHKYGVIQEGLLGHLTALDRKNKDESIE